MLVQHKSLLRQSYTGYSSDWPFHVEWWIKDRKVRPSGSGSNIYTDSPSGTCFTRSLFLWRSKWKFRVSTFCLIWSNKPSLLCASMSSDIIGSLPSSVLPLLLAAVQKRLVCYHSFDNYGLLTHSFYKYVLALPTLGLIIALLSICHFFIVAITLPCGLLFNTGSLYDFKVNVHMSYAPSWNISLCISEIYPSQLMMIDRNNYFRSFEVRLYEKSNPYDSKALSVSDISLLSGLTSVQDQYQIDSSLPSYGFLRKTNQAINCTHLYLVYPFPLHWLRLVQVARTVSL